MRIMRNFARAVARHCKLRRKPHNPRAQTAAAQPAADDQPRLAALGLATCIQCGLCDASCPSGIALLEQFQQALDQQAERSRRTARAERAKARYAAHNDRAAARAAAAAARRQQRLESRRSWRS